MLYVEINHARDRAELVTDDRAALREQLEAATGERIATLEAVEPEKTKVREATAKAGVGTGRENGAPQAQKQERERASEAEQAREPIRIEHDLGL